MQYFDRISAESPAGDGRRWASVRRAAVGFARAAILAVIATMMLAAASAAPARAQQSAGDPLVAVKSAIDEATVVFEDTQISSAARQQKLRAIAERNFDFEGMARSTVGAHWRDLTPQQQSEFVPLFTHFIEDVYLTRIQQYSVEKIQQDIQSSNVQFTREARDDPDDAEVFSTVTLKTEPNPIQVNYLLRPNGDGWRIYDITIDAISVIANYRNQFNRVINNQGYAALVNILRQKQQALGADLAK